MSNLYGEELSAPAPECKLWFSHAEAEAKTLLLVPFEA